MRFRHKPAPQGALAAKGQGEVLGAEEAVRAYAHGHLHVRAVDEGPKGAGKAPLSRSRGAYEEEASKPRVHEEEGYGEEDVLAADEGAQGKGGSLEEFPWHRVPPL